MLRLLRTRSLWGAIVLIALITYVGPAAEVRLGLARPDFVIGQVAVGSLVLLILVLEWTKVHWARRTLRQLATKSRGAPARIVRVNEFGRSRTRTLVLVFEANRLLLRDKASEVAIARPSIESVEVKEYGAFRANSVMLSTNLFGPIELVPLQGDAVFALDGEGAAVLAEQIGSL